MAPPRCSTAGAESTNTAVWDGIRCAPDIVIADCPRRLETDSLATGGFSPPVELGERVISAEQWAEIRRLHRVCQLRSRDRVRPKRAHCGSWRVARNTAREALATDELPTYLRPSSGAVAHTSEPQIRVLRRVSDNARDSNRRADRVVTVVYGG